MSGIYGKHISALLNVWDLDDLHNMSIVRVLEGETRSQGEK
jgi:hypothetical protein